MPCREHDALERENENSRVNYAICRLSHYFIVGSCQRQHPSGTWIDRQRRHAGCCSYSDRVWVKLIFFSAPIAKADARSVKSVNIDISQMHQSIKNLPVEKFHEMSLVFSDGD
jgi:hypothetical protein